MHYQKSHFKSILATKKKQHIISWFLLGQYTEHVSTNEKKFPNQSALIGNIAPSGITQKTIWNLSLSIYIYIYVCVCVREREREREREKIFTERLISPLSSSSSIRADSTDSFSPLSLYLSHELIPPSAIFLVRS